jgi:3-phenylpropionate/trans-cinnamate dioxygenase ferredoxin subunit
MALVQVAGVDEIPPGGMKAVTVGEAQLLIVNREGSFYAINRFCPHRGGDLAKGRFEGFVVTCPRHGAQYDVRTGGGVAPPKIGPLKLGVLNTPSYSVTVDGDAIKVEIGA